LYSLWDKNGVYIFKCLEKNIKRRMVFHGMEKLCEIQFLVSINKALLEHNHVPSLTFFSGHRVSLHSPNWPQIQHCPLSLPSAGITGTWHYAQLHIQTFYGHFLTTMAERSTWDRNRKA
jgi:hypothetical protein